jgi:xylono-1,5-lactonase
MMQVYCVADAHAELGEGPLWDADRGLLWWVDIKGKTLHSHHPASGDNRCQRLEQRLTALGMARGGDLIACGDQGFVRLRVDLELRARVAEVIACPAERAGNRFNDGKIDAHGRFWAGTMDDAEAGAQGCLYWIDAGHRPQAVRSGIRVPNGPCFLADGTVLTSDTARGIISALDVDVDGQVRSERVFAHFGPEHGYPDGMTVDAQDHVWIAFWDGGCLRRLSPRGQVVQEVPLPVRRPTCPAFGGPDLDQLYVTSACTGLSDAELGHQPWAGGLLRVDVGVRGRAPGCFNG